MNSDKLSSGSVRRKERSDNLIDEIRSMEERIFENFGEIRPTKTNRTYSFAFRNDCSPTVEKLTSMRSFPEEKDVDELSNATMSQEKDINLIVSTGNSMNTRVSDFNDNLSVPTQDVKDIDNWQDRYPFDERENEVSSGGCQSASKRTSVEVTKHPLKNNFTISDLSYSTVPVRKSDRDLKTSETAAGNGDSARFKKVLNIKATENAPKRLLTKEETNLEAITEKSDNIDSGIHPSSSSLDSDTFSETSLTTSKHGISKCNIVSEDSSISGDVDSDLQLKAKTGENSSYDEIASSNRFNTFVRITSGETKRSLRNESRRARRRSQNVKAPKMLKQPAKKDFVSKSYTTSTFFPSKLSSMKLEVNDTTCETVKQNDSRKQRSHVDDINVCNILTSIHEQLTYDSKRKQFENVKIAAQLLGKVIARCKSYIHNSENSEDAVIKINKLLSNCTLSLQRAVNEEEVAREENETQHRHPQFVPNKRQNEYTNTSRRKNTPTADSVTVFTTKQRSRVIQLIECMSSSLKVIIAESDEKGNMKYPLKSLLNNDSTSNRPDRSTRNRTPRSRSARLSPIKNDGSVDTQISILTRSNDTTNEMKSEECNPKNEEKAVDKVPNNATDKKFTINANRSVRRNARSVRGSVEDKNLKPLPSNATELNQTRQNVVRQKFHASDNVLPVWRPAGVARNPLSSTTVSLVQKCCPANATCTKERTYAKTRRAPDSAKKSIADSKDKALETNLRRGLGMCECLANMRLQQKMKNGLGKERANALEERMDANLEASSKCGRPPRATNINKNETLGSTTDGVILPNCESSSSWESMPTRSEVEKKSRIIHTLKDTIKSLSEDRRSKKVSKRPVESLSQTYCNSHIPTDSYDDSESRAINERSETVDEKKTESCEEEPTRDTDSIRFTKSQNTVKESLQATGTLPNVEAKLPSSSPRTQTFSTGLTRTSVVTPAGITIDSEVNVNFDQDRPADFHNSVVSLANVSCTAEFSSTSNSTTRIPSTRCCQTSLNYRNDIVAVKRNENTSKTKSASTEEFCADGGTKKGFVNAHSLSLNKLKEFLCRQGVDPNLVNRAERDLNEKYKVPPKSVKRKSWTVGADKPVTTTNPTTNRNKAENIIQYNEEEIVKAYKAPGDECCETSDIPIEGSNSSAKCYEHKSQELDDSLGDTKNSHDTSCQTDSQCGKSEGSQTAPERQISTSLMQKQTVETQTEKRRSVNRDAGTEYCKEYSDKCTMSISNGGKNVSSMTDTVMKSVSEVCTETVEVPRVSKSVMTLSTDLPRANESVERKEVAVMTLEEETNQTSMSRQSEDVIELLEDPCEVQDCRSSPNYIKWSESRELRFVAPTIFESSSSSTSLSSECTGENRVSTRNVPDEILMALQALVQLIICTCETHDAMNIYRGYLEGKTRRMLKERANETFIRIEAWNDEVFQKSLASSNSSIVINDHKAFNRTYDNANASLNPVIKNISLYFTVDSDISRQKLPSEFLNVRVARKNMCSIESDNILENNSNKFCERTSGRLPDVLPEVESLVNFLLFETEDKTVDVVNREQEVSLKDERPSRSDGRECATTFAIVSRKNLLPLMYGVLSSIVFWCLQFSVTCDSGLSHGTS